MLFDIALTIQYVCLQFRSSKENNAHNVKAQQLVNAGYTRPPQSIVHGLPDIVSVAIDDMVIFPRSPNLIAIKMSELFVAIVVIGRWFVISIWDLQIRMIKYISFGVVEAEVT